MVKVAPEFLAIARLGSLATAGVDSLGTFRFGSLAIACVGSLATISSGSLLAGGFAFFEVIWVRFFVIAFIGLSGVLGADFCVIT